MPLRWLTIYIYLYATLEIKALYTFCWLFLLNHNSDNTTPISVSGVLCHQTIVTCFLYVFLIFKFCYFAHLSVVTFPYIWQLTWKMWKKSFPATMLVSNRNHQAWMVVLPSLVLKLELWFVHISSLKNKTFYLVFFLELRLVHIIIKDRMENNIKGRRIGDNLR